MIAAGKLGFWDRKTSDATTLFRGRDVTAWIALFAILSVSGCNRSEPSASVESSPGETPVPHEQATTTPPDQTSIQPADTAAPAIETETFWADMTDLSSVADPAREAAVALETGDIDSAYRYGREAVERAPDDPQVVFLMARVLGARHRYPEAIRMLDRLADSHPDARLPVLGQTSEWLVRSGDYDAAEQRLRMVLEEIPNAAVAHRELARLLLGLGRRFEAAQHLHELCGQGNIEESELLALLRVSIPLSATMTVPLSELAEALNLLGQQRIDQALDLLQTSAAGESGTRALVGRIFADLDRTESLERQVSAFDDEEKDPYEWFALGAHHESAGRYDSAVRCYAEVVARDPTDARAYALLSRSLAGLSADDQADEAANRSELVRRTHQIGERLLDSIPDHLDQLDELIQLLDQLQRFDESIAWQAVRLIYRGKTVQAGQAQSQLNEINHRRIERLKANSLRPPVEFNVCGIDLRAARAGDTPAE